MKYTFYSNKSKDISNFLTEKFFFQKENGEGEVAAMINYFCKYSRVTNVLCTKASSCFLETQRLLQFWFCSIDFRFPVDNSAPPLTACRYQSLPPRPDPPETRLSAKNVTEMGVIRAADLCLCLLNQTSAGFCVFCYVHGRQKGGNGNELNAIWNVRLKLTKKKMFLIIISLAAFLQFTSLHVVQTPGVSFDGCWLRHRNFPQHLPQQRAASRGDTAACPVVTPKVS